MDLSNYTSFLRSVEDALETVDDYTDKHETFGDLQSLNAEYSPEWVRGHVSDALSKVHDMLEAAVGDEGTGSGA